MLILLCLVSFLIGILISGGKTNPLLLLLGAFLFRGILAISSEILLAFLLISFQVRGLFPVFIKIGEIDIVITAVCSRIRWETFVERDSPLSNLSIIHSVERVKQNVTMAVHEMDMAW